MPLLACLLASTPWLSAIQYAPVAMAIALQEAHVAESQVAGAGAERAEVRDAGRQVAGALLRHL